MLRRYRVISLSVWLTWATLMLATVSPVLATTIDSYNNIILDYLNVVLWSVMAIGFDGFQANVIQFGIDQLRDASSTEIYYNFGMYVIVVIL